MAIKNEDLLLLLVGAKAFVSDCEGNNHTTDDEGCLCSIKGCVVTIGKQYESLFAGTPSWHLEGSNKRARLSELTLVRPDIGVLCPSPSPPNS